MSVVYLVTTVWGTYSLSLKLKIAVYWCIADFACSSLTQLLVEIVDCLVSVFFVVCVTQHAAHITLEV